ncbi:MAG: MerR family transcriptional regulator [Gammaproteobacteria bacterium]|nr:MerR family transcriptional regulator [Gammaproteobacteria bacterium]MCP5425849.1 MerR family transcriptional regulator [Gammaproteobacteria bacterium]MCP5458550.1 MerR family transcriptional regulator [Gammaproteobacteria bacterium]
MINEMTVISGTLLDDSVNLSLYELCRLCGVNAERIMDMIDEGLIEPGGAHPREWRFGGRAVVRVQVALRLQRDLRVNLAGAALALDLLEEIASLRRRPR